MVESYEEIKNLRDTIPGLPLMYLCHLLDLDHAMARLGPKEYQAVLLVGHLGIPSEAAGRLLGVSQPTMWRRYTQGLELLTTYINESR